VQDSDDRKPRRGLMTPDPEAAAAAVSIRALLWGIAGVLAVVELALKALAG
jgi:hypothetical protein